MFANPKAALGFAGVTIAIAIAASFGANHFLPSSDQDPPVAAQTEEVAPATRQNKPAAAVAWADEGSDGGFSDDWNDSAVDSANGFNDPSGSSDANEMEQPSFGDFAPQSREASRDRRPSSSRSSSSSSPGPRIESRAAPNAPPLQPPGGGGNGELIQVD